MATDDELVDHLEAVWSSMAELGESLDEPEWGLATEVPGWTVQDNLAHITAFEWVLLGRTAPEHEPPADLPHVKNDIGRRNEVFVDSRRDHTGAEVLAEFEEITTARVAQLRAFDPDDFGAESWTPVGPGTVRDLLPFRIFDSWVHEQDMRRAVGRPGNLDSAVAATALERIVTTMPFVVGKRAGAPDGSTIHFGLSGPLGRTFTVGVEGRAHLLDELDELAGPPTATIATDTETFARLACGRLDAAEVLATDAMHLGGDVALGRQVVENLNFLF